MSNYTKRDHPYSERDEPRHGRHPDDVRQWDEPMPAEGTEREKAEAEEKDEEELT